MQAFKIRFEISISAQFRLFTKKTVPPQWTGKLHDRNFRLTRRCFSLFWEVSVHTFNSSLRICLISSLEGLDLNFEHSSTSSPFFDLPRVTYSFNLAKFKAESTSVGCCKITWSRVSGLRPRTKQYYILIRYPAQTNIKHLSCNKQPQLGCVNTSRVRPSLLCLHQQNGWK